MIARLKNLTQQVTTILITLFFVLGALILAKLMEVTGIINWIDSYCREDLAGSASIALFWIILWISRIIGGLVYGAIAIRAVVSMQNTGWLLAYEEHAEETIDKSSAIIVVLIYLPLLLEIAIRFISGIPYQQLDYCFGV